MLVGNIPILRRRVILLLDKVTISQQQFYEIKSEKTDSKCESLTRVISIIITIMIPVNPPSLLLK